MNPVIVSLLVTIIPDHVSFECVQLSVLCVNIDTIGLQKQVTSLFQSTENKTKQK